MDKMFDSGKTNSPKQNRLLAALPGKEYERLAPHIQEVSFEQREFLYHMNGPIDYAYFPLDTVISALVTTQGGASVEIGLVGREGFTGYQPLLGMKNAPNSAVTQLPGRALKIESSVLKREFERGGRLQPILHRHIQSQIIQMAQSAACNRLHEVNERLARWLLMMHDRAESDTLTLTHEFLSQMLGANRATVSLAAGVIQQAGLIRYSRGTVVVLNREGLEEAACECYPVLKAEFYRGIDV